MLSELLMALTALPNNLEAANKKSTKKQPVSGLNSSSQ
jgi:hypothetical protein